jgi:serine/threonine-protein kinase
VNEARAAAKIGHPGIVEVFDLGVEAGATFIAMEMLEGDELQRRIDKEGPLPVALVVQIGIELADAMAAAHEHGIVHRDLKPSNIFLAKKGRVRDVVKVLDFGIAKLTQDSISDIQTRSGAVFGTPLYMAPEQLRDSKQVDFRADVYAIGAILFHALTGAPPFEAPTAPELFYSIVSRPPPSLKKLRDDVPEWLETTVLTCLAKSPRARVASCRALCEALEHGTAVTSRVAHPAFASTMPPPVEGTDPPLDTQPTLDPEKSEPEIPPRSPSGATVGSTGDVNPVYSTAPPRRSHTRSLLTVGALAAIGLASFFVIQRQRSQEKQPTAPAASSAPTAPVSSETLAVDKKLLEPERSTVRIVTIPPGAEIELEGSPGCLPSPCDLELPQKNVRVAAHLAGHQRHEQTLSPPFEKTITLRLKPAKSGPAAPPTTKPNEGEKPGVSPPPLVPR